MESAALQMAVTVWTSKAQWRTSWRVLNELKGLDGDGWILMVTSLAVATPSVERSNVFADYSRVFVEGYCNCGCVETPVKKPDDWAIPPISKVEQHDLASATHQLGAGIIQSYLYVC